MSLEHISSSSFLARWKNRLTKTDQWHKLSQLTDIARSAHTTGMLFQRGVMPFLIHKNKVSQLGRWDDLVYRCEFNKWSNAAEIKSGNTSLSRWKLVSSQ